jgi:hypothetical protein
VSRHTNKFRQKLTIFRDALVEDLAKKAGQPAYKSIYGGVGFPTMVLVDKEGKIMIPPTMGGYGWKTELEKIFE